VGKRGSWLNCLHSWSGNEGPTSLTPLSVSKESFVTVQHGMACGQHTPLYFLW
jgi:hypothetical protein